MQRLEQIYEGKAKRVYRTDDPQLYVVEYKDDATAFNGLKKGQIADKGIYNNRISSVLFQLLSKHGIKTHFVKPLSDREMLVKSLRIIPLEVVVRNVAAGSLAKRVGLEEGTPMSQAVLEFYYKRDDLGDPLVNDYHIRALNLATPEQLETLAQVALDTNRVLTDFLRPRGLLLVDFKLEFGLHGDEILLGDEISPDTCRLWDTATQEKLDKDRFRRDLGGVEQAYQEVWRRVSEAK